MRNTAYSIAALVALGFPNGVAAQDKYDAFVGDWVASVLVARSCAGMTTLNQSGAAEIAQSQEGLRRQKTLRLLLYGKTTSLEQMGAAALAARNLSASDTQSLCSFGRSVAGKNDRIGRFLRVN